MGSKFSLLEVRISAYPEVMKLAKAGVTSPSIIMRTLRQRGIVPPSKETVRRWVIGANSPFSNLNVFVPEPSEELSFFTGAWYGDGWGDKNDGGKRMRLKVRSKSFAEEFADAASEILHKDIPYRVWPTADEDGTWYNVKVTSRLLYDFVLQDFADLIPLIEPSPRGFLRGFFTAEGNPAVSVESFPKPWLGLGVVVSNSDTKLLEFASSLLRRAKFVPGKLRLNFVEGQKTNLGVARSSGWLMSLSRFRDVKRFADEIGFADQEKQEKLLDAISILARFDRYEAATQWKKIYEKVGKKWARKPCQANASL